MPKEGAQKGAAAGAAKAPIGKKLPAVPESVLLRRKRRDHDRLNKVKNALKVLRPRCLFSVELVLIACFFQQTKVDRLKKRKTIFKRAEAYVKEYRMKEREEVRLARQARNRGNYYIPGEARLAFVVRIRG